jgi:hypothetical protein
MSGDSTNGPAEDPFETHVDTQRKIPFEMPYYLKPLLWNFSTDRSYEVITEQLDDFFTKRKYSIEITGCLRRYSSCDTERKCLLENGIILDVSIYIYGGSLLVNIHCACSPCEFRNDVCVVLRELSTFLEIHIPYTEGTHALAIPDKTSQGEE